MDSMNLILGSLVFLLAGIIIIGWKRMELFHRWNNRTLLQPIPEDLLKLHEGMQSWDIGSKLQTLNALLPGQTEVRLLTSSKDVQILAVGRSGFIETSKNNEIDYAG